MHLVVYVITAACFVVASVILIIAVCSAVASSKSMYGKILFNFYFILLLERINILFIFFLNIFPRHNQLETKFCADKYLIHLDESLSLCGQYQIDIRDLTIQQFQEHFQSGNLTSTELTDCYLQRIKTIDVYLKSVIEINPDAIQLAQRADRERLAK